MISSVTVVLSPFGKMERRLVIETEPTGMVMVRAQGRDISQSGGMAGWRTMGVSQVDTIVPVDTGPRERVESEGKPSTKVEHAP